VNWLKGFPAVEHSAPPRNDILKGLQNNIRSRNEVGESVLPLVARTVVGSLVKAIQILLVYMQMLYAGAMLYKKTSNFVLEVQTNAFIFLPENREGWIVGLHWKWFSGSAAEVLANTRSNRPTALSEFHITCILNIMQIRAQCCL
jgi:hypothetical protein